MPCPTGRGPASPVSTSCGALAEADGVKLGVVDIEASTWRLETTENQRDHTTRLSDFGLEQLQAPAAQREVLKGSTNGGLSPWVFPASDGGRPVCIKSFGKQLADRMARAYIQDRREADQCRAFDALGRRLADLMEGRAADDGNVAPLILAAR